MMRSFDARRWKKLKNITQQPSNNTPIRTRSPCILALPWWDWDLSGTPCALLGTVGVCHGRPSATLRLLSKVNPRRSQTRNSKVKLWVVGGWAWLSQTPTYHTCMCAELSKDSCIWSQNWLKMLWSKDMFDQPQASGFRVQFGPSGFLTMTYY